MQQITYHLYYNITSHLYLTMSNEISVPATCVLLFILFFFTSRSCSNNIISLVDISVKLGTCYRCIARMNNTTIARSKNYTQGGSLVTLYIICSILSPSESYHRVQRYTLVQHTQLVQHILFPRTFRPTPSSLCLKHPSAEVCTYRIGHNNIFHIRMHLFKSEYYIIVTAVFRSRFRHIIIVQQQSKIYVCA